MTLQVITPVKITPSVLIASSIPMPDASVGEVEWSSYSATAGDRRIMSSTRLLYECVVNTTDAPNVGAAKPVPTWIEVSSVNRYRAFDSVIDTKSTESASPLSFTFQPNTTVTSVCFFNMSGVDEIQITMTDPTDGVVYDETISLVDLVGITDYWEWFFLPPSLKKQVSVIDLPPYPSATISVTLSGAADVGVGEIVIGLGKVIGVTLYGTAVDTLDYSRYDVDDFGNRVVTRRRQADLTEFRVGVMKERIGYVRGVMRELRGIPTAWVGDAGDDITLVFGYPKLSRIPIETPTMNTVVLTVEGLV